MACNTGNGFQVACKFQKDRLVLRRQAENAVDLVRIAEAVHYGAERIPIGSSLLRRNGLQVGNGLQFLCKIENGGPALQMFGDDLYGICGWNDGIWLSGSL